MTSEEYRALNGTLGLELAVHSCFGDNILIVGMSLDDDYLRRQIVMFRGQIRSIYWMRIESDRDEGDEDPRIEERGCGLFAHSAEIACAKAAISASG